MFEQHPVPQQISSYQFRLVGDMTLKQFFQVAAGALLGLLVYASPLPSIFKWPLIIIFVVMGAAFAFLPLQERPLEEWMSAFFRSIYGPTLFRWQKLPPVPYFASAESGARVAVTLNSSYAATQIAPSTAPEISIAKLEASENSFLSNLTGLFHHTKPTGTDTTSTQLPQTPPVSVSPAATPMPAATVVAVTPSPVPPSPVEAPKPQAGTLFVATPQMAPVTLQQKSGVTLENGQTPVSTNAMTTNTISQTLATNDQAQTGTQAQFSPEAAPPSPSTIPNVIVGQVMTSDGKIIEGAIMEIMDFQGRPVRALKTNRAGHFMIVTPLPNGQYKILIEKEGLTFEPIIFETHGTIIPPIAIKAKGTPAQAPTATI